MFTVVAGFLIAAATADVQSAAVPAPVPAPVAAKPRKICRSEVAVGSILPKHTCLTQPEWDARARATEGDAEALRRAQGVRLQGGSSN